MKTLKYILSLTLVFFISCTDDNDLSFIDSVPPPLNVSAQFLIAQDNSGLVTITPNSEGGVSYNLTLDDGTLEPVHLNQGESIQRTYAEGTYSIGIEAIGITGLKSVVTQELVVYFKPPENLVINAVINPSNPFLVEVTATADYAASFLVFFDTSDPNEEGTPLALEGMVSFEYPSVGDYTIKVVALSGGTETSELTQVVTISSPVILPIDFEIFDATVFQGFGGASNAVIDNPDTNGNDSAKVGQIVKGAPEVWAGNVITLSSPIDFSEKKIIKMDVWSPRPGGKVLLKVENLNDAGIFYEKEVTILGNSSWEEVFFDLTDIDISNTYQKIVLFFDIGTVGDGSSDWTFYIDNIKQVTSVSGTFAKSMIEDFNGAAPSFISFGNAAAEVITLDSPTLSISDNVVKFTKTSGAEVWAGTFFETVNPLDLDTYSNIRVKTWSPKLNAVVKVKIENADASITHEVDMNTTIINAWEELIYDFSTAPAADYVRVVIFFDFGNSGDGSIYYFDDVELINNGALPLVFQDFEGADPGFISFGNAATQGLSLESSDLSLDVSKTVAILNKPSGAEVWAGSFFELETPLDLNSYPRISVKTWSPKLDAVVKVKIENADASVTHEIDMNTTVTDAWEELVYDFSTAPAADYIRVVIFFDFGNPGDDTVYGFDDFTLTN